MRSLAATRELAELEGSGMALDLARFWQSCGMVGRRRRKKLVCGVHLSVREGERKKKLIEYEEPNFEEAVSFLTFWKAF